MSTGFKKRSYGSFSAVFFASAVPLCAQITASDDAAAYFKTANWTNGSNQGYGLTPWALTTNSFSGGGARGFYLNNGYAIATPTNIPGVWTNLQCSWGIYANGAAPAGGNRTV